MAGAGTDLDAPPATDLEAPRLPLARASALPTRFYLDPALYALEVERIFRREWLCVGRADQLARPGDYFTFELLGDLLVAVRGDDGAIRVLSRVCRHRSMPVVSGSGNRRSFQCPYHLWTYALDGQLLGAPDMQRAEGFEKGGCRLPSLPVEIWQGWIFTSFDPEAAPLAPRLEGLRRAIEPYGPAAMQTGEPLVFEHEWNWKVMVENFVESYHHQGIHRDTLQPIVPASGTWAEDAGGPYVVLHNPTKDGAAVPALFAETPGLTQEQRARFVVGAVFPLHLFSVQRDSLVWYRIEPRAVDRFALQIHLCTPPPAPGDDEHAAKVAGLRGWLDTVHRQDMVACAGVQSGLGSSLAAPGRLSHLEKAIWQLNQYVLARIAPLGPEAGGV
jgi:phenylpropionate dioxygenase-like ring-hydroxylating dioxygenase large terminal subunit